MATIIISLGGSLINPRGIDTAYLKRFSTLIKRLSKKNSFVIVTGGGTTARTYINALRQAGFQEPYLSSVGIEATKLHASLVAAFFHELRFPLVSLQEVEKELKKSSVVICGALGFTPNITSDADAAEIAEHLHAPLFINLTNVNGLYTKNPASKGARLIQKISHEAFRKLAHKKAYRAGQHFVLDQTAATIISRARIKTLILNGKGLSYLEKALQGEKFLGTTIT